jgi:hypothetical protein
MMTQLGRVSEETKVKGSKAIDDPVMLTRFA